MEDPRPIHVLQGITVQGAIAAATLVTSGLALLDSVSVTGTAVVGTSLVVTGPITGAAFSGVGSSLTALNASNLTLGTIPVARLGSLGTAGATTFLRGDNSWNTAVTQVTVTTANGVSASVATQGTTPALTFTLGAITPTSVAATGAISGTTLAGAGSAITALNATNLGSGTVPVARLGSTGTAGATTFLRGDNAWSTAVTTLSVVTANGISGTVATATTTPAITLTLGTITPTSVAATGNVGGATLSSSGLATLNSLTVTNGATAASFTGVGTALTALNASNLGSGTVALARLGTGTPDTTKYLRGDNAWTTAVSTLSVVTANGISGTVATATTTPAITLTLGAITPTSVTATGAISGATLAGDGSAITALNAGNLGSGTIPIARLAATGVAGATTFFRGDNSWSTAVTAATVTTANGVSATIATQGTTPALTFTLGDITPTSLTTGAAVVDSLQATGTVFSVGGFTGPGGGLAGLNASNLGSGTVPLGRLGSSGTASASTFLSGTNAWISAVTAVTVATANGVSATVLNQGTTPQLTLTLGAITPTSVAATGNVGGATISSTGLATLNSLTVTGNAGIGAALSVTGNATVGGTLGVTGAVSAPTFTGALVGTSTYTPTLTTGVYVGRNSTNNNIPQFGLIAASAPTNVKASSFYVDPAAGTLNWALLADDLTTNTSFMTVARTGNTATNITFTGTAITLAGAVSATGGFSGSGASLLNLNATQLLSGTVPVARLGSSGTAGATTFLRGDNSWQTAVTAVTIVTANGISASVANQGTTPALTLTLGAITPSSVSASGNVGAATMSTTGQAQFASMMVTGASAFSTVTVASTLDVTGNISSAGAASGFNGLTASTFGVTNNATIGGTLGVTGVISGPGSGITALNASNLASGTVPVARLGSSGTPSANTFLSGANTWTSIPVAALASSSITIGTTAIALGASATTIAGLTSVTTANLSVTGSASVGGALSVTGAISGNLSGNAATATSATTATNLAGGTTGQVAYQTAANTTGFAAAVAIDNNGSLQLTSGVTPVTPTTDPVMGLYAANLAGRNTPAFVNSSGAPTPVQTSFAHKAILTWNALGNAAGFTTNGSPTPTVTGTAQSRSVATTNTFTSMRRAGYTSVATAGNSVDVYIPALQFWIGNAAGRGGFYAVFKFGVSDAATVANSRMFVGLCSTASAIGNVNPSTLLNMVGVGCDTAATTLSIYSNNGSGAAVQTSLGANFPSKTLSTDVYELILYCAPNDVAIGYQVTNLTSGAVASGSLSADIPVNTQLMTPHFWRNNGTTGLAVGLDIHSLYIETDF